jgi:hypothetical protein
MPTVSTSQILGNNESFEPITANVFTKTTLSGKHTVINDYLMTHLAELGLGGEDTLADIMKRIANANGSVAGITELPAGVRAIYATVWEMSQFELMRRSSLRGAFVDQSQSLNEYLLDNSNKTFRSVMIAGWQLGLKTGTYYARTTAAAAPMKNNNIAAASAVDKRIAELAAIASRAGWSDVDSGESDSDDGGTMIADSPAEIDARLGCSQSAAAATMSPLGACQTGTITECKLGAGFDCCSG